MRRAFPLTVDMDEVRALHAQGYKLKQIAFALGIAYNTLASRTAAAGLRFRNNPHKTLRPKQPPKPPPAPPPEPDALAVIRSDNDRTRQILDLYDRAERAATHWDRDALLQRIEALRA